MLLALPLGTVPDSLDSGLPASVKAFGQAFRVWRKQCGITQTDIHKITKALGAQGPYGSQVSRLENGELIPQPWFFERLAEFNRLVADKATQSIPYKQKEKIQSEICQPFMTADGQVADAADFFLIYLGKQQPSEAYTFTAWTATSPDQVTAFNHAVRSVFEKTAELRGLDPAGAWQELSGYIENETLKSELPGLLFGFAPWPLETVNKYTELTECPLRLAFERWLGVVLPPMAEIIDDAMHELFGRIEPA